MKWIETIKNKLSLLRKKYKSDEKAEPTVPQYDTTEHVCRHCGFEFRGKLCPQCGMSAGWQRFTFHRLLMNFLDIWGMGNRPMFRSMWYLLRRPGYMIRDYLNGHFLSYFPPFKMLAVLTVFVALFLWLTGTKIETSEWIDKLATADTSSLSSYSQGAVQMIVSISRFFNDNALYRLLIQVFFLVVTEGCRY